MLIDLLYVEIKMTSLLLWWLQEKKVTFLRPMRSTEKILFRTLKRKVIWSTCNYMHKTVYDFLKYLKNVQLITTRQTRNNDNKWSLYRFACSNIFFTEFFKPVIHIDMAQKLDWLFTIRWPKLEKTKYCSSWYSQYVVLLFYWDWTFCWDESIYFHDLTH